MLNRYVVVLAVVTVAGCPTSNSEPSRRADAQETDGGGRGGTAGAAGVSAAAGVGGQTIPITSTDAGRDLAQPPPAKPNGSQCASGAECASGFCADHLCCNTACDAQCYACDQPSARGTCKPLDGQDDLSAIVTCTGTNTCKGDGSGGASCKHRDGQSCASGSECASGFCADHVCCNTACDAQCYACDQPSAPGACTPLNGQDDVNSVVSCAGVNTCSADTAGGVACKFRDGEACNSDTECASGQCRSYYVDADGDGYGVLTRAIKRCDGTPNPPAGYATLAGDCCDSDAGAHPGVQDFFTKANACGSYDWNCAGGEEKQDGGWCPSQGAPGASIIACGSICCYGAGGYTSCSPAPQACR